MRRARNTRIDDLLRDRDLRSPDLLDREVQRPDLNRDVPLYEFRERNHSDLSEGDMRRSNFVGWVIIIFLSVLLFRLLFK